MAAIDSERWFVAAYTTFFMWWPEANAFSDQGGWQGWQALDGFGLTFWSERPVDIATVAADDFMAVWETNPFDPGSNETILRGRRISARAVLLTEPFEVTRGEPNHPRDPRVATLPSSRVVVVWVDDLSGGTDDSGTSIQARLFTIEGVPLGPIFQVNTTIVGDQTMPDVAADPAGRFVVAWQSESSTGSDQSGTSIHQRRFNGDGSPTGSDEQVNTYTDADQSRPRVACGGEGSCAVAWQSDGSSGDDQSSLSIQARLFDPSGTPVGTDFQVNSYTDSTQSGPAVAMMASGDFVVVWTSDGSPGNDNSEWSIQRQAFDADGARLGAQLQVNSHIELGQWSPDIAMNPDGDFVVVWDDHDSGLRGRIFRQPLLADGFESGDLTAWSAVGP
jgi:hypothetical protein